MSTPPTTCTVVVSGNGAKCGKPAVTTFVSKRSGAVFAECAEHATSVSVKAVDGEVTTTAASLGVKTRSTQPYVLVADGKVVGYAAAPTPAVFKRAAKLGAKVLRTR